MKSILACFAEVLSRLYPSGGAVAEALTAAWDKGRTMTWEQAVEYALGLTEV